jgi:hypothetical protein
MLGMRRITVTVHSFNGAGIDKCTVTVIGNHLLGACFTPTLLGEGRAHAHGCGRRRRHRAAAARRPLRTAGARTLHRPSTPRISIMAEVSRTPRLTRAAAQAAARVAPRRKSVDRRLRLLEWLTIGLSIAHIKGVEQLMAPRVRR